MSAPPASLESYCAHLFEAKGIQRWILEGGRLRNIAAASNVLVVVSPDDGGEQG